MSAWMTAAEVKGAYPQFAKLQVADNTWVTATVIPKAQDFVTSYVNPPASEGWEDNPPGAVKRVAINYAVNKILASDETVRIAQARGQPSFIVSGDTVQLDLSIGRNPLLSPEDEAILIDLKEDFAQTLHTDKVVVRSQGQKYNNAPGGDTDPGSTDFVRGDSPPSYFAGH